MPAALGPARIGQAGQPLQQTGSLGGRQRAAGRRRLLLEAAESSIRTATEKPQSLVQNLTQQKKSPEEAKPSA
jgi:hypothetical protein